MLVVVVVVVALVGAGAAVVVVVVIVVVVVVGAGDRVVLVVVDEWVRARRVRRARVLLVRVTVWVVAGRLVRVRGARPEVVGEAVVTVGAVDAVLGVLVEWPPPQAARASAVAAAREPMAGVR